MRVPVPDVDELEYTLALPRPVDNAEGMSVPVRRYRAEPVSAFPSASATCVNWVKIPPATDAFRYRTGTALL